ncbi:MAG: hypothetical protein ACERKD_07180 [Prolixibacteraceae bacterium]
MRSLSYTIVLLFIAIWVSAQSPHGNEFKKDCALCHSSKSWVVDRTALQFNHDSTKFVLAGQHQFVNCRDCHSTLVFIEAKLDCASCHSDVHNNTVGKDCARCHTPNAWLIKKTTEMHQESRFPLMGGHKNASCTACHVSASQLMFEPIGIECVDCHQNDFQQTTEPNHVESGFSTNCTDCHRVDALNWNAEELDHSFFPLTDGHKIGCVDCHTDGTFQKIPANCIDCHQTNFDESEMPKHVEAGIPVTCEECHTPVKWKPSIFDHNGTGFELTGGHQKVEQCSACHDGSLTIANPDCFSCHQTNYNDAPNHLSQVFPTNCLQCHTTETWNQSNFDHSKTNFPLLGQHASVDCASCHTNGFVGTESDCNSCHAENYQLATSPNHLAAGIPSTCEECHSPANWKPSSFNHSSTGFALTGGHQRIEQCSVCHEGDLTTANPDCFSCHQTQYNGAPEHVSQSFPTNCVLCHTTDNWLASNFDHSKTNFPLVGQHVSLDCASCHTNGFTGTPDDCNSCHSENYKSAQSPNHLAAGIPSTCEECHTPANWKPSAFNHITTGFELTGGHRLIEQCSACHIGSLVNANQECISCHQVQYDYAPEHKQYGYPLVCTVCHTTNDWLETNFNHNATNFPLVGQHINVDCATCHTNGFAGTSTQCSSCHMNNFQTAQLPSHTAAGIPVNCEDCHTPSNWKPSSFNHASTGFQLTGGHLFVEQCSDCHHGSISSASPECLSCHQTQYNGAPNHVSQGYPTSCTMCHSTNNWLQTNFDHSQTNFPLTGAHASVDCSSCHSKGFTGTSTACISCHQADYNGTTNPNHAAANFPSDCSSCHSVNRWTPATFNHDSQYFPIYSGKHRGEWNSCTDCHTNVSNYAVFSCIDCHEHNKSSTDSEHRGVKNYVYQSTACYSCHPTGRE